MFDNELKPKPHSGPFDEIESQNIESKSVFSYAMTNSMLSQEVKNVNRFDSIASKASEMEFDENLSTKPDE